MKPLQEMKKIRDNHGMRLSGDIIDDGRKVGVQQAIDLSPVTNPGDGDRVLFVIGEQCECAYKLAEGSVAVQLDLTRENMQDLVQEMTDMLSGGYGLEDEREGD